MKERRRLERFDLHAPARIEVLGETGAKDVLSLTTKDISSAGAYVSTDTPLPEGAPVKLELLLSVEMITRILGANEKAKVRVKGKVIRVEDDGMAIQFDSKYKILMQNAVSIG